MALLASRPRPACASVAMLALTLASLGFACSRSTPEQSTSALPPASFAPPIATAPSASAPTLPPLQAPDQLDHIPLDGFGPATVALPMGATTPRPVLVALHGHAVRPEHACVNWARASLGRAFVLCPHGLPARAPPDAAVTFGSTEATRSEIDAALRALQKRYSRYVAEGPVAIAGYSLGARMAVSLVRQAPSLFPIAAFGEGGYDDLSQATADQYARNGVRRVLLVCSTKLCEPTFERARARLERAGVDVRLASSGGSVHMFEGEVTEVTRSQWAWLVGDDPRWHAP